MTVRVGQVPQRSIGGLVLPPCRAGNLEVRLAQSASELRAAQSLRYRIFYEEMRARPSAEMRRAWRDTDAYDASCDHLIVLDHAAGRDDAIVGTYRLIDAEAASATGGFYSSGEYDLSELLAVRRADDTCPGLLELGRSCVAPAYRTSTAIMLLWRGIAAYLEATGTEYMFGCASFPGTEPERIAAELSYLHHRHRSPIAVRARPELHVRMDLREPGAIDERQVWRTLPPLIRGYLQAGALVGDGAVIDHQFSTVDVFVVVATAAIRDRYRSRFLPTHG